VQGAIFSTPLLQNAQLVPHIFTKASRIPVFNVLPSTQSKKRPRLSGAGVIKRRKRDLAFRKTQNQKGHNKSISSISQLPSA
jgi:hypothetical protein